MTSPPRTRTSRPGRSLAILALATAAGCAATSKQDILESRLRHQEDMLSSYQAQLDRVKTELDIARRESADLHSQLASSKTAPQPRDHIDAGFRATSVEFSTLMTGGTNVDDRPGDDGLAVVLVPQDPDGELVKVPGTVEIEAFDVSHPSGARRVGHWQFDASESHRYWHKGVIQSGYQFELPWQELPQSEKLLLHGRLVTVDGRQFDTTHNVRIDPPDPALVEGSPLDDAAERIEPVSAVSNQASTAGSGRSEVEWALESGSESPPVLFGHADRSDGHAQSARQARALTGEEFADRLRLDRRLRTDRTRQPDDRPASPDHSWATENGSSSSASPQAGSGSMKNGTRPADTEVPPAILDPPEEADWAGDSGETAPLERSPVRTSDSWTDSTLPYLR